MSEADNKRHLKSHKNKSHIYNSRTLFRHVVLSDLMFCKKTELCSDFCFHPAGTLLPATEAWRNARPTGACPALTSSYPVTAAYTDSTANHDTAAHGT